VIREVAAAPGLEHGDAFAREHLLGRDDIRRLAFRPDAKRDDGRMFEQQQRVARQPRPALMHQLRLELEPRGVFDAPQAAHLDGPRRPIRAIDPRRRGDVHRYIQASSKFCRRSLSASRNRPASAPSMSR
jgi:hypothetical protein